MGGRKTSTFHDLWNLLLWGPFFMDRNKIYQHTPTTMRKLWKHFKQHYVYKSQQIGNLKFQNCGPDLEKSGTEQ